LSKTQKYELENLIRITISFGSGKIPGARSVACRSLFSGKYLSVTFGMQI
jgi:hypothetical protein